MVSADGYDHEVASERDFPTLPRGRHNLSREQVTLIQRQRLLLAMASCVSAKGFAKTSVADVLAEAGVSRETFYQNFADKEACFRTLMTACADTLSLLVEQNLADHIGDPLSRFEHALEVYLGTLAEEVQLANVFHLESLGAGHEIRATRFDVQKRFVEAVAANFADDPGWSALPDPKFACEMLVSAISTMVTEKLALERADELPRLREPIVALLGSIRSMPARTRERG